MFDMLTGPNPSTGEFLDPTTGLPEANYISRFNHLPGGINVLYLDGHVEFVRYKDRFPATPGAAFFIGGSTSWASAGEDLWEAYALSPESPF